MDFKRKKINEFVYKLRGKLHNHCYVQGLEGLSVEQYFCRYPSYHYALKHGNKQKNEDNFLASVPNPGAGIGHQIANWMAGYYYAKVFGLKFAHIPFSSEHQPLIPSQWERFLGFGEGETTMVQLKVQGYKTVRIPLFNGNDEWQMNAIHNIIASYADRKVVFLCEQDQFLRDLQLLIPDLQHKFYSAPARKDDKLQYNNDYFNIAVHVRRTVIIDGKTIEETPEVRAQRWLSNDYYENVLKTVLENIKPKKPIAIWLFSTGKAEEFKDFAKYGEVHFSNDMDEYQSFAHLVFADLLITSKSSFSYKPALMNRGIKVCPRNFWHGYPDAPDWILCDNEGLFDIDKLKALFK